MRADDSEIEHVRAEDILSHTLNVLRRDGVDALHFYTLNRAERVGAICAALGIGASAEALAE